MRWRATLLVSLLAVLVGSSASADCAGPTLEVSPRVVGSRGSILVRGDGWNLCNDTPSACAKEDLTPPQEAVTVRVVPATPARWEAFRDVRPVAVRNDAVLERSAVPDEAGDWRLRLRVAVPPGDYFVVASGADDVASTLLVYSRRRDGDA